MRLRAQKEHPKRWKERLGETNQVRPTGELIWLHAVGLGEVMALRGLIDIILQKYHAIRNFSSCSLWSVQKLHHVLEISKKVKQLRAKSQGRQFSKQPESIMKKTRRFR